MNDAATATVTDSLFHLLAACHDSAPSLAADISSLLFALMSGKHQQQHQSRLQNHLDTLVAGIKGGHSQLLPLLKAHPGLLSVELANVEAHVESLLTSVGVMDLSELLVDIAEKDARKLIRSLPVLLQELEQNNEPQKKLVLGILLAIAVHDPAAVAPYLGAIEAACYPPAVASSSSSSSSLPGGYTPPLPHPQCRLPLLKLLAAVGAKSKGDSVSMQCLAAVARITRAKAASLSLNSAPATNSLEERDVQAACLEAVNVIKDKSPYCNIFHRDTLKAMDTIKASNPSTHRNLCKWNAGKIALKGDLNLFLLTAGQGHVGQSIPPADSKGKGKESGGGGGWWSAFIAPGRSKSKIAMAPDPSSAPATRPNTAPAASSTPAVYGSRSGRAVGPSPFFNHGEASFGLRERSSTTPVAKNLFGSTSQQIDGSSATLTQPPNQNDNRSGIDQSDASQYVSFSEFLNRQKSLSAAPPSGQGSASGQGAAPGEATATPGFDLGLGLGFESGKSDALQTASPLAAEEKSFTGNRTTFY